MAVTIETERLHLRPIEAGDIPALMAGLNDWEVVRYLTVVPFPYTRADAEEWVGQQVPPMPGLAHLAIELPDVGLIGVVGLADHLGYWLHRAHHGRGYMSEATTALLDWHFASRPGDTIPSSYHVDNAASERVQQKLGFLPTGQREMRHVVSQSREVEHIGTSLTRRQFEAARLGRA